MKSGSIDVSTKYMVIYWSRYGATEEIAGAIQAQLGPGALLINVNQVNIDHLKKYNEIIIGCPVYLFKIPAPIKKFISLYTEQLKLKKLSIFISSTMNEKLIKEAWGEKWLEHFFNPEICRMAAVSGCLGGRRVFDRLSSLDKLILNVGKKKYGDTIDIEDFDTINKKMIEQFCGKIRGSV